MANILTLSRIGLALLLLFSPALYLPFLGLYAIVGLMDMLDGYVARKTGTASEVGEKTDTVVDFVFTAVCLIKLLPIIDLPAFLLIWTGIIALIKLINIISGFVVQKKLVVLHTVLNKLSGLLLFLLPLTLPLLDVTYSGSAVCAIATLAAIQEGHLIRTNADSAGI